MEVIVLAGGMGTRLRAAVPDLPKPMAPIGARPFLEVLIESLKRKGFRRVILSVGYKAEVIEAYFARNPSDALELVFEVESKPLGTGGAIARALKKCREDHVFVVNGDTFLDFEADQMEALWQRSRLPLIVGRKVSDTARYGRIEADESGRIYRFREKTDRGAGIINGGCYLLPTNIMDRFPPNKKFSFEDDFLRSEVEIREMRLFVTEGYFIDIGIPEEYQRAIGELAAMGYA